MTLKELKKQIEENTLTDSMLIFKYIDNDFLCLQYLDEICRKRNKEKCYIESINEINSEDSFFGQDPLYIIIAEKFTEIPEEDCKNLIIIAKEFSKDFPIDYIEFPKLVGWQVEDYLKLKAPGLSEKEIKWLCEISKYDIFRLNNEASKFNLFTAANQEILFRNMVNENAFCDLNSLGIFNLTTAVLKRDYATINEILKNLAYIDVEATGLITIFNKNVKNMLDVQTNPTASAESLGMQPKQYSAIKYNASRYTTKQLIKMFDFLTNLDYRLKNGDLQFGGADRVNNTKFVNYIITNLLRLGKS